MFLITWWHQSFEISSSLFQNVWVTESKHINTTSGAIPHHETLDSISFCIVDCVWVQYFRIRKQKRERGISADVDVRPFSVGCKHHTAYNFLLPQHMQQHFLVQDHIILIHFGKVLINFSNVLSQPWYFSNQSTQLFVGNTMFSNQRTHLFVGDTMLLMTSIILYDPVPSPWLACSWELAAAPCWLTYFDCHHPQVGCFEEWPTDTCLHQRWNCPEEW